MQKNTYEAVELLMDEKKKDRKDIMFEKGENMKNPWDKWTRKANNFLKKQKKKGVKTHDFRKTTATNLYKKTGDIL